MTPITPWKEGWACSCQACENEQINQDESHPLWQKVLFVFLLLGVIMSGGCWNPAHADILKSDAIKAVIGEAENQDLIGMIAVACSIRNRGNLTGVYGLHSKRVLKHKYSKETYAKAHDAVEIASSERTLDYCAFVKGSTGWGSVKDGQEFMKTKWWKNCVIVYRHKDHFFYKEAVRS